MPVILPMCKKLRISKVRSSIIRTQSKPSRRKEKLAVRAVSYHPRGFQRSFSGKVQSALHGHSHRPAGAENSDPLAMVSIHGKLGKPALHARAEVRPRLDSFQRHLSIGPPPDHNFKDLLKCFELLGTSSRVFKRLVHFSDVGVAFN